MRWICSSVALKACRVYTLFSESGTAFYVLRLLPTDSSLDHGALQWSPFRVNGLSWMMTGIDNTSMTNPRHSCHEDIDPRLYLVVQP